MKPTFHTLLAFMIFASCPAVTAQGNSPSRLVDAVETAISQVPQTDAPRYADLGSAVAAAITEDFKLTASDRRGYDRLGYSVSLSGDRALVGAHGDDDAGDGSGSAYVFDFDGTDWIETSKLTASDAAVNDGFGFSVSVSGDTALVGSRHDDDAGAASGSAYVFDLSLCAATCHEVSKLTASDAAPGDEFGISVSVSGNRALVGAEYDDDAGTGSGSAYVFDLTTCGSACDEVSKLTASDAAGGDEFGVSVSVSGDMGLVGAWGDDDGGTSSGSAYVFDLSTCAVTCNEVSKLTASDAVTLDRLGGSVSVSGDRALVSSEFDDDGGGSSGSAYVFDLATCGATCNEVTKLTASDAASGDIFGSSVSISGDWALVGAWGDDDGGSSSGSAYAFDLTTCGATCNEMTKFTASDAAGDDDFGISVSISGDRALVGAYGERNVAGAAYVFDFGPPAPLELACTPVNPPISIPPGGGSYFFEFAITNIGGSSITFDLWSTIDGPGTAITNGPYGPSRELSGGASLTRTYRVGVPPGAPPNTYTHTCHVGTFDVSEASDSFTWTKSAAPSGLTGVTVAEWTSEEVVGEPQSRVGLPEAFALNAAYPNPFNPSATLSFDLPESAIARLIVYDAVGREVARLVDGRIEAGRHEVTFDASNLPSGVYFARFTAGNSFAQTHRLTLLK